MMEIYRISIFIIILTKVASFQFQRKLAFQIQEHCQKFSGSIVLAGTLTLAPLPEITTAKDLIWNMGNGNVEITEPFTQQKLSRPRLLGSGGGGAVFALEKNSNRNADLVVKVSWVDSAESVERECKILQILENGKVQGVERCLGMERYQYDERRVVIILEPVLDNYVNTISELDEDLQAHAVQCVIKTMIQMIGVNVATTDVQPLVDKQTGNVLFIDMTEAKELSRPLSFVDLALVTSFSTEMLSLIPNHLDKVASTTLFQELQAIEERGAMLQDEIYDVLRGQTQFMLPETLIYIDKKIGPA